MASPTTTAPTVDQLNNEEKPEQQVAVAVAAPTARTCRSPPKGVVEHQPPGSMFRPFTPESLQRIRRRIEEEAKAKELAKQEQEEEAAGDYGGKMNVAAAAAKKEEEKPQPNPLFEAGKPLPPRIGDFPPSLYGRPIEDLDDFYATKCTFMIVARDHTMFRFSSTDALYLLSPFNPVRRIAMYILTHPFFSLSVMVVILANCVIMASGTEPPNAEEVFTGIYTVEGIVKMLARGFIMADFHYLRDAWNWLDFVVVTLSYATMSGHLGKVAALRTFRVLRALKTVAVVPGLKTIVGALLEAVRRLRDVAILSVFVLSIFALIGLQLYPGSLKRKCVLPLPEELVNATKEAQQVFWDNNENWYHVDMKDFNKSRLCEAVLCPEPYICRMAGENPDFGYTNFDNFGWAMLCAFRLMTQDFWESLYQLTIKTNGQHHMLFFVIVIFMGSFYLVNVILAIVAMSYDDCRRAEAVEAEAEDEAQQLEDARLADLAEAAAAQQRSRSGSAASLELYQSMCGTMPGASGINHVSDKDQISMKSDCGADMRRRLSMLNACQQKASLSLPGSPFAPHRAALGRRRSSQFSWRKPPPGSAMSPGRVGGPTGNGGAPCDGGTWRPMVVPCLDNLELPYADDSAAVTPTSEELCNFYNTHYFIGNNSYGRHRLSSSNGSVSRMSQLESRFTGRGQQQESYLVSPYLNQLMPLGGLDTPTAAGYNIRPTALPPPRAIEPTHFHWNTSSRRKRRANAAQDGNSAPTDQKTRPNCNDSSASVVEWDPYGKGNKLLIDNPFLTRTPSATVVDMQDVLVLKDLIKHASGKKKGLFGYEKGMNKKEFAKEKCMQLLFGWECHPYWYKFAHIIELFIMDAFVDLFITLCIVVNTLFMAMEHANMDPLMEKTLTIGNYVFTTIFTVEAGLKILALGLYKYLQDKWSCFDIIIVILSLVELGLDGIKGLSILRSFRLLRVFKLAKSWPTLNLLIGIIGRTMGALGNLCFVLAIIIFIFAVMGKELFGQKYIEHHGKDDLPRWNFCDFLHAFMIVFRVLCGEWIESMWGCINAVNYICIPFFLLTMIIGSLVVLNLFLALLLSSFGAESLKHSQEEEGPNKLQEAIDRINRFVIYIKSHISYCIKVKIRHKALPIDYYFYSDEHDFHFSNACTAVPMQDRDGAGNVVVTIGPIGNGRIRELAESIPEEPDGNTPQHCNKPDDEDNLRMYDSVNYTSSVKSEPSTVKMSKASSRNSCLKHSSSTGSHGSRSELMSYSRDSLGSPKSLYSSGASDFYSRDDDINSPGVADRPPDIPEINEVNVVFVKYPDECCPKGCSARCPSILSFIDQTLLGRIWWKTRCYTYVLVEHNYFETFIISMIIASSLALAVEDYTMSQPEKAWVKATLGYMDRAFTVIFVFEMVIKMAAYGFKKYFTDAWCWLDFVIVVISLISWSAEGLGMGNIGAFRALRTLRALRPLRAVSRWEGMKVVVNALIQAIPSIFNVLLVCLVFWLIFSIMGVNLFSGKYGHCVDLNGENVPYQEVNNESQCIDFKTIKNYSWVVPKITFNNVPIGYLALFQVATFKGWMDIMYMAIDSRESNQQPHKENKAYMYLYFVLFIVFGAFFTLNLFIGVIIEQFNLQKKKAGGSLEMLMTEDQKKYYNAMKKLGSKQPTKPIPKPKFRIQLFFFELTKNQKFDIAIMIAIMLNMLTMAIEYHDQPESYTKALEWINKVFIVIFTLECLMKMFGLRFYYFKEPWNVFDFVVVVVSLLMQALQQYMDQLPSPTLLRVVRVFRVGRVLRLVKSAKGIRTLLFSLAVSMPALFNIGLLLFLVMFIYAVFGMNFFMHVKHTAGIDEVFNFQTFFRSMIVLFQTCTSAGWDGVLAGLSIQEPDCNGTESNDSPTGDCGSTALAIVYLVTYLVITFLVVINMYIAVILENFSQATEDVQQGLTQDDFDMYYETWEKFDEAATQYIPLSRLSEFVDALEEPLKLPAPNLYKLVSLNIPICTEDRVHCVDILDALTKNFLGTVGDTAGELGDLKKGPERLDYKPVSTTLKRQREMFVARLIQRSWRNFVKRRHAAALLALADSSSEESLAGDCKTLDKDRPLAKSALAVDRPSSETVGTSRSINSHLMMLSFGGSTSNVRQQGVGVPRNRAAGRGRSPHASHSTSRSDVNAHRTDKR